jgi:hypothetical protein
MRVNRREFHIGSCMAIPAMAVGVDHRPPCTPVLLTADLRLVITYPSGLT